jgi:hypothetical protein
MGILKRRRFHVSGQHRFPHRDPILNVAMSTFGRLRPMPADSALPLSSAHNVSGVQG